jgi:hypothetical protein
LVDAGVCIQPHDRAALELIDRIDLSEGAPAVVPLGHPVPPTPEHATH